jgi:hypothetical protein
MRHLRADGAFVFARLDLPIETVMLAGAADDFLRIFRGLLFGLDATQPE